MDCKKFQTMIIYYIEDKLSSTELEDFLEHLNKCKLCRDELEIYYIIKNGLDSRYHSKEFNIEKSIADKIKKSELLVKKSRLFKIISYTINSLLILSVILSILLQIRIWWQGGYLK